jgi:hypothetical protein
MSARESYLHLGLSKVTSVIGEGTEDPEDDSGDDSRSLNALASRDQLDFVQTLASVRLTTETAAYEDPEQDQDDYAMLAGNLTLTTMTKANENQESDPDEDCSYFAALHAMTTTLTESSGDHESDPDDDLRAQPTLGEGGSVLPLAYRFAESVTSEIPQLGYDKQLQVHVLRDGTRIVDFIQEHFSQSDSRANV